MCRTENRESMYCCTIYLFCKGKQCVCCTKAQVSDVSLKYSHCVYLSCITSYDLLSFSCLLYFLSRTSELKWILGREMQRRDFLLMYRHPTYMPMATSNGYSHFLSLLHFFHNLNAFNPISNNSEFQILTNV